MIGDISLLQVENVPVSKSQQNKKSFVLQNLIGVPIDIQPRPTYSYTS